MILVLTPDDLIDPAIKDDLNKINFMVFKDIIRPTLYFADAVVYDNGDKCKIMERGRYDVFEQSYGKRFADCSCASNLFAISTASSLGEAIPTTT